MPILYHGARKLRNAGKLNGLSIITRTASETKKNTLVINWKERKKDIILFCD